jgi:hypothetical protein
MIRFRHYLPLAALAASLIIGGCHSDSNQNQPPQGSADQAQPPAQQPAAGAPGQAATTAPTPAPPPPPAVIELPAGTQIRIRLDQELSSKDSQPGDSFRATVADDVTAHGEVVIPKGARAEGTVVDAKPLGRFKGGALLAVKLDRVHTRFGGYPVDTSSISRAEKGKGKRSAGFIGGGAGLGALIGGLAGGGKGAAIGALAGGGAGTAGSAFTGNKQIVLPAETLLTFSLERSIHIVERDRDPGGDPALKSR